MKRSILSLLLGTLAMLTAQAQNPLYQSHFNLSEITLLDSPLKTAMDKNISLLLCYDIDRLLTPYVRQSGLTTGNYAGWETAHPSFSNWGSSDFNLDGHVGGHYLSAISLAYAACHDTDTRAQLKAKVDYMVSVMKDCQAAYDNNTEGLKGFIGGQPMNNAWKALYQNGNIALRGTGECAVPWYCQHKIMAGLRDAYVYGGNADAREVFLKLCDWAILVTSNLSENQMQQMLATEHGGVNEMLLDAYVLTNETKYLTAAKRFTHAEMLNGMQSLSTTFLDNRHANTQVPKYVGMERIGEADGSASTYRTAAENFWTDVAQNRTVCIGGNSMYEHFISASSGATYIDNLDGPESCNTNNMMKLSEMMGDRTHDAKYADFYEYAMWNHILSTQDPTTGGYVYFTTLRPQAYRIYSTVNESMWCCVGTGMENHSKYGHFAYTHDGTSTLYVNLFMPSQLQSSDFVLTQTTSYPFSDQVQLTVGKAGTYTIAIRHPWWTTSDYAIAVNGTPQSLNVTPGTASYATINRTWAVGDVITVTVPMVLRYTTCPNYNDYIAFQYGPILLAAQTTATTQAEAAETGLTYEALQNEYGHEGRMDHAPGSRATRKSLTSAPLLIGNRADVLSCITVADRSQLRFTLDASREDAPSYTWQTLTLKPFYQIHHARYSCYWYQQTADNFAASSMAAEEAAIAAIETRTLDFVATGEQQSEAGHYTVYENSTTGVYNDEHYRDARPTNGYIQYTLSYEGEAIESGLSVLCRFTQADAGRKATLYVDGTPIANITSLAEFNGTVNNGFYNVEFPIPASLMRDAGGHVKQSFTVRLAADKGTNAPGLYYLRLMKDYDAGLPVTVTTSAGDVRTVIDGVVTGENGQSEMSHGFTFSGSNTSANHGTYQNKYWRNDLGGELYAYDLSTNGQTEGVSLVVEYWAGDGQRFSDISIDGVNLVAQQINSFFNNFVTIEYPVDPALLEGRESVHVQFASADGKYSPGSYHAYLTTGRPALVRQRTPYTFMPENFEKNGSDGNISSVTYADGAIHIASGGGNYQMNMRMKPAKKNDYSILPQQFLFVIKGQNLSSNAYLWWLMGCNHGAQDAPTYTYADGSDRYLIWDLRKVATFNEAEKMSRFFGYGEVPVTTSNGGDYSLSCFGLTSSAADGSATISDIGFYSPEQLVDTYSVLKGTVPSLATSLTTSSSFVYGDYAYLVTGTTSAEVVKPLSTAGSSSQPPATVFGYNIVATEAQAVEMNRQAIIEHNGEATSLIQNAECNATDGWTGSGGVSLWGGQNWRGTGDQNDKYLDVGGLSYVQQTLSHMPAGYYKLVAALRAYAGGTITPYLNASAGTSHSGLTYGGAGVSMMNRQGVQMPADANFHGYGEENTRGWQWGTATTQLETDGDLTIRFNLEGGWWKCIDDVHLYYSTTADGFHTISDAANQVPSGKVLTCDIILANPNTIVSSASAIATASGEQLNNNLVDGNISTLVLFDGYNFEQPEDDYTATAATFYRNIPADTWCSLVLPFVPTTEAVYMQPSALNGTVLQFVDATQANDSPVIVRSSSALDAITGSRSTAASGNCTGGSGVPLVGTYEYITAVPYGNYVLGTDNRLYLVDSSVSLNPFRAYFNAASVQGVKASILTMNTDTQTAIDEISLSDTSLQRHSSKTFDLTGRPVQQTHQKGIYVTGRKKVVF